MVIFLAFQGRLQSIRKDILMKMLSVIKSIPTSISRGGSRKILTLKKYSPEILLGLGIAGGVTAAVMACSATSKMNDVMEEHIQDMSVIEAAKSCTYDQEQSKEIQKMKTKRYLDTGVATVKLYGPAVGVGAASIACILGSYGILHKRNVALMAAYSVLNDRFINYRKRVRDDLGYEADKKYLFGTHKETIEVEEVGKNGKTKKVKKEIDVINPYDLSQYAKCFDSSCLNWENDPDYNKMFLTRQQNWANDKLKAQGHLFLNEVYDMLGFPRSKAGTIIGWIYDPVDPDRDSYVDFGIFNIYNETSRDFVNGYEKNIWLDFNVDGVIYDLI